MLNEWQLFADTKLLGHSNLLEAPLASIKWGCPDSLPVPAPPVERPMVLRQAEGKSGRNRSHQREAGRAQKGAPDRSSRGGICVNLPVHKPDFRNPKSMTHTHHTPGQLWQCFGLLFFFFAFIFKDQYSLFSCPHNENRIFKCLKYTYITDAHTFQKS